MVVILLLEFLETLSSTANTFYWYHLQFMSSCFKIASYNLFRCCCDGGVKCKDPTVHQINIIFLFKSATSFCKKLPATIPAVEGGQLTTSSRIADLTLQELFYDPSQRWMACSTQTTIPPPHLKLHHPRSLPPPVRPILLPAPPGPIIIFTCCQYRNI